MKIVELDPSLISKWNAFVAEAPEATLFHSASWYTVLGLSTPLKPRFLIAQSESSIVGVMPLVHARSRIFGNVLSSTPFCMKGGPLGSEEANEALTNHAIELGRSLKVDLLEIRSDQVFPSNGKTFDSHCYFTKAISSNDDENLKSIPRKQRAMVRKGLKSNLISRQETSLDNFFQIYSTSLRNLGTPTFPKPYFTQLKNIFGDACEITTVFKDETALCSVMSFRFRDQIMPYYGGGLPSARKFSAFDFMYWEVMRKAAAEGATLFDYGRSRIGSGSYKFKKNWGFEPEPLPYSYLSFNSQVVPVRDAMSKKYQMAVSAWKKLPLSVANRIGPMISPYLA